MPEPRWVQVVFALPLAQEFTYRLDPPDTDPGPWIGRRVQAPFRNRTKEGVIVGELAEAPVETEKFKSIEKVLDPESLFGPLTLATAAWMAHFGFCTVGEALMAMLPSARREREAPWATPPTSEAIADHELMLSEEQQAAIAAIGGTSTGLFYLKGMTGSGKTEVFLQAARQTLDSGRSVIYLVPEIALTWQLRETLSKRFGSLVAVLHSHLTPSQKLKQWRKILSGEARLVVGARSAIFAPLSDLGLIVIDEEHEGGYKSGSTPRYHARQVAHFLAGKTGARLVLGSATPSLEAVHQMRTGRLTTLTLSRRLAGGAPPIIQLVPLARAPSCLTPTLLEKVHQTLTRGRQVVLFLNRRGYSSSFFCRTCATETLCRNCSVSMTWHKSRGILLCHYCGSQARPTSQCPSCGSLDIGWSSIGTEQVEQEVAALFPDARIARLDSDTAEKKGYAEAVVEAFRAGQLDILIGTQMVAKGLNFPGLQLVGLLQADMGLSLPDFRSAERVFNLIRQVSGRAGRFLPDGEVIVQTLRAEAPAIALAAQARDEEFWTQELALREALRFPPYTRLIRLVVRGKDEAKVQAGTATLAKLLRAQFPGPPTPDSVTDVLGPVECALAAVAGNRRWQVIVRGTDFPRLHHGVGRAVSQWGAVSGLYLEIDVDPLSML